MIPKISYQYIAGFFDGEGCVRIQASRGTHKNPWSPEIHIVQKEKEILSKIKKRLGLGHLYNMKGRYYCLWIGGKKDVAKFANAILPYTIVKKNQLKVALEFCNLLNAPRRTTSNANKRKSLYDKLKQLNQKKCI